MENKRQQTAASLMFAPNQNSIQILEGRENSFKSSDNDKMRMTALSNSNQSKQIIKNTCKTRMERKKNNFHLKNQQRSNMEEDSALRTMSMDSNTADKTHFSYFSRVKRLKGTFRKRSNDNLQFVASSPMIKVHKADTAN